MASSRDLAKAENRFTTLTAVLRFVYTNTENPSTKEVIAQVNALYQDITGEVFI